MSATFGAHCPAHGYGAPHVETAHGPRCLRCINERRRAQTPDADNVLTFNSELRRFMFRARYDGTAKGLDLRNKLSRCGFRWDDLRRVWWTDDPGRAGGFFDCADTSALLEFREAEERAKARARAADEYARQNGEGQG